MKSSILILIALLAFLLVPVPRAISAAPTRLAVVSDTLSPPQEKDYTFSLSQTRDFEDFLFHVVVTANAPETDMLEITLDEGDTWWATQLQGDWWDAWGRYGFGPLTAGEHTLTVATSIDAANAVTFTVEFYEIPTTPVALQGTFTAQPYNDVSYIHISLPEAGAYTVSADATAGNFALVPEAPNDLIEVLGPMKSTLQIDEAGVYEFQVWADYLETGEATAWSFAIGSPTSNPVLRVKIEDGCRNLAPGASCIFNADATASDGGQPNIQYNWTTTGGCFVSESGECLPSILGQNVNWTAPGDVGETTYKVTVNATAEGYENGLASWPVVVPEFSSASLALTISIVSATGLIMVGRRRRRWPQSSAN
jgi:hypothetical protein